MGSFTDCTLEDSTSELHTLKMKVLLILLAFAAVLYAANVEEESLGETEGEVGLLEPVGSDVDMMDERRPRRRRPKRRPKRRRPKRRPKRKPKRKPRRKPRRGRKPKRGRKPRRRRKPRRGRKPKRGRRRKGE